MGLRGWGDFRVRVRNRVSVSAKGWLGFIHYGLKLLELKLRCGGGFGKIQNCVENNSKSPERLLTMNPSIGRT